MRIATSTTKPDPLRAFLQQEITASERRTAHLRLKDIKQTNSMFLQIMGMLDLLIDPSNPDPHRKHKTDLIRMRRDLEEQRRARKDLIFQLEEALDKQLAGVRL